MLLGVLALVPAVPAVAAEAANAFSDRSDEELTALAADWDALDRHQRRALLTEMKLRMARKGEGKGVIHIRTERRYGRLIRQPDGRVIRIETKVVHVRPIDPEEARQRFGVGFEHRIARREADAAVTGETEVNEAGAADAPERQQAVPAQPEHLPIYQVADPAP